MDVVEDVVVDLNPVKPEPEIKQNRPSAIDTPSPPKEEPQAEEPAPKPAEDPVPKGVQKRIDRAVREKYEAQARAKMLEERLSALENQRQPQQQQRSVDSEEPTLDKFDNLDQYVAAKAAWIAKHQIHEVLSEREQRAREASEAAERSKTAESWSKRVSAATAEMPDFEDVLSSSTVPMTEPMRYAIMESDIGPKVAYYLANNPDEATKIAGMSPIAAIRTIGRIEEKLSAAPVKTVSQAPAPITPVGSKSAVKKDPGQMTDAEYAKWRKTARL